MKTKCELNIVIDKTGIKRVEIVGPIETHPEGHQLYFALQDLFKRLDAEIQMRLANENKKEV